MNFVSDSVVDQAKKALENMGKFHHNGTLENVGKYQKYGILEDWARFLNLLSMQMNKERL